MKWLGEDVISLTDDNLIAAHTKLSEMEANYNSKLSDRKKRHENIEFKINPTFIELQNEIVAEINKRGLEL